jgi:hypothetical protein
VSDFDGVVKSIGDELDPERVARHEHDVADLPCLHPNVVLRARPANRHLVNESRIHGEIPRNPLVRSISVESPIVDRSVRARACS